MPSSKGLQTLKAEAGLLPLSPVQSQKSAKGCSQSHQLRGCPQVVPQRQKQTHKTSCEPHLGDGFVTESPSTQNSNSPLNVHLCLYLPSCKYKYIGRGKASQLQKKKGPFLNLKFDSFVSGPEAVTMAEESEFYQNFCLLVRVLCWEHSLKLIINRSRALCPQLHIILQPSSSHKNPLYSSQKLHKFNNYFQHSMAPLFLWYISQCSAHCDYE